MRTTAWPLLLRSTLLIGFLQNPAKAQNTPVVDLFGGYSYLRTDRTGSATSVGVDGANLHGWETSVSVGLRERIGILSSFSGHYGDLTGNVGPVPGKAKSSSFYTFLFGPEYVVKRSPRVGIAVHVAGGIVRTGDARLELQQPLVPPPPLIGPEAAPITSIRIGDDTTAAFGAGGSIDIRLTDRLSYRIVKPELIVTFSPNRYFARLSTGLVFHLGRTP